MNYCKYFVLFIFLLIVSSCSKDDKIELDKIEESTENVMNYVTFQPSGQTSVLTKYNFANSIIRVHGEDIGDFDNTIKPKSVMVSNVSDGQNVHIFSDPIYNHYILLEYTGRTTLIAYIFQYDIDTEEGSFLFKMDISDLAVDIEKFPENFSPTNPHFSWMSHVATNYLHDVSELDKRIKNRFKEMGNPFTELEKGISNALKSLNIYQESVAEIRRNSTEFLNFGIVESEDENIKMLQKLLIPSDLNPKHSVQINSGNNQCGIEDTQLKETITLSVFKYRGHLTSQGIKVNFTIFNPDHGSITIDNFTTSGRIIATKWILGSASDQILHYTFPSHNPFLFDFRNFEQIGASLYSCPNKYISKQSDNNEESILHLSFACVEDDSEVNVIGCGGVDKVIYVGENLNSLMTGEEIPFTIENNNTIRINWELPFTREEFQTIPCEIQFSDGLRLPFDF